MNAENAQQTMLPTPGPAYGSPGMAIRLAREKAGLSLDELATRTRLAKPTLEALENDAYEQLLEPVYVRGYYRKCASALGIDEAPLVAAYRAAYTPKPTTSPARLRLASGGDLGSVRQGSKRLMILVPIAVIVIGAVAWVALQDSGSPGTNGGTDSVTDSSGLTSAPVSDTMPPLEGPIEGSEPLPADATTEAMAVEGLSSVAGSDGAAVPVIEGAAAPEAGQASAAAAPVGVQLVLEFSSISWARVEDASGKSLLSGVVGAGESRSVEGRPPYSVFLGNAPGVKVTYGGQPIDLKPLMQGNSTARFSVPVAGQQ